MKPPRRLPQDGCRRAAAVAGSAPGLAGMLREARAFAALDRQLAPEIPAAARAGIGIARVRDDTLVIAAIDAAHATRARMLGPTLLDAAGRLWPRPLKHWHVVVSPQARFERGG